MVPWESQVAAGLAQDEGRALSQAGLHLAARSVRFDGVKKLENVCANEDLYLPNMSVFHGWYN